MELPKFIATQCFEAYSIDSKFKLIGMKDLDVKVHNSAHKRKMILTLLSDTLIITAECYSPSNKQLLLYPPMPLTHITLEKGIFGSKGNVLLMAGSDMIYSLKISPYVMLILKPTNVEFGLAFVTEVEGAKNNVASTSLGVSPKKTSEIDIIEYIPKKLEQVHEELYQLDKTGYTKASLTKINQDSEAITFSKICNPQVWRVNSDGVLGWTKLSKSIFTITRANEKTIINLSIPETKRSILGYRLEPSTVYSLVKDRKMLDINMRGERFVINFDSVETVKEIIRNLDIQKVKVFQGLYETIYNQLRLEVSHWLQNYCSDTSPIRTMELGRHSQCQIKTQDGRLVQVGPVTSYIIFSGEGKCEPSRLLQIRSDLDPTKIILSIELDTSSYFARPDDENWTTIRIFNNLEQLDFRLYFDDLKQHEFKNALDNQARLIDIEKQKEVELKVMKVFGDLIGRNKKNYVLFRL
jgi:hypothetical protein